MIDNKQTNNCHQNIEQKFFNSLSINGKNKIDRVYYEDSYE